MSRPATSARARAQPFIRPRPTDMLTVLCPVFMQNTMCYCQMQPGYPGVHWTFVRLCRCCHDSGGGDCGSSLRDRLSRIICLLVCLDHNSFRCPVTRSTTLLGPSMPNTVALPAAICVLPASCITLAHNPRLTASACNVSSSSSDLA